MKNMTYNEMMAIHLSTTGALSHLKYDQRLARRRNHYEVDFQSMDNPFIRDDSAILCAKAKRRECCKTQVTSNDDWIHMRVRITHVGEVKAHAQRIADHLDLNVFLAQSISEGHDSGHVPFGHQGEDWIRKITGQDFTHEKMGVIVAQKIERGGKGLNLTFETLDGMFRHSGNNESPLMTQEARVVRWADKIAYLFADYNDFARMGWKCSQKLTDLMDWFGKNQRERTFRTIVELCNESARAGKVQFTDCEAAHKFAELRTEMYLVYTDITTQDVDQLLSPIYELLERTKHVPPALGIALLTDREVLRILERRGMKDISVITKSTGLGEIIDKTPREHLFSVDITDMDLNW